jgi:hypothetical protein
MDETAPAARYQEDRRSLGACQHGDPELFFPIPHGPGLRQLATAKAVCACCGGSA